MRRPLRLRSAHLEGLRASRRTATSETEPATILLDDAPQVGCSRLAYLMCRSRVNPRSVRLLRVCGSIHSLSDGVCARRRARHAKKPGAVSARACCTIFSGYAFLHESRNKVKQNFSVAEFLLASRLLQDEVYGFKLHRLAIGLRDFTAPFVLNFKVVFYPREGRVQCEHASGGARASWRLRS